MLLLQNVDRDVSLFAGLRALRFRAKIGPLTVQLVVGCLFLHVQG